MMALLGYLEAQENRENPDHRDQVDLRDPRVNLEILERMGCPVIPTLLKEPKVLKEVKDKRERMELARLVPWEILEKKE